ncbi:MAG TPA: cytochrome P450 [Phormidium sp.]
MKLPEGPKTLGIVQLFQFPFGGGTRRCIGIALAPYEIKIVLATILANWQLSLADKTPVRPIRRGFTLRPKGGVRMVKKISAVKRLLR